MASPLPASRCGLTALRNLGATCYMNAVLQCLVHVPEFVQEVFRREERADDGGAPTTASEMWRLLANFAKHVWAERSDGMDPSTLFAVCGAADSRWRRGISQDTHEFFMFLLNSMDAQSFRNTVLTEIRCHACGTVTSRSEQFFCLEIPLADCVGDGIVAFGTSELMTGSNAYACDTCARKTEATRAIKLDTIGPCLAVMLKRFDARGNKIPRDVAIEDLILRGTTYTPMAVACHSGGLGGGHHWAVARVGERWFTMDDARIAPAKGRPGGRAPYIVFYERTLSPL